VASVSLNESVALFFILTFVGFSCGL